VLDQGTPPRMGLTQCEERCRNVGKHQQRKTEDATKGQSRVGSRDSAKIKEQRHRASKEAASDQEAQPKEIIQWYTVEGQSCDERNELRKRRTAKRCRINILHRIKSGQKTARTKLRHRRRSSKPCRVQRHHGEKIK
jgi:hypothetical protein